MRSVGLNPILLKGSFKARKNIHKPGPVRCFKWPQNAFINIFLFEFEWIIYLLVCDQAWISREESSTQGMTWWIFITHISLSFSTTAICPSESKKEWPSKVNVNAIFPSWIYHDFLLFLNSPPYLLLPATSPRFSLQISALVTQIKLVTPFIACTQEMYHSPPSAVPLHWVQISKCVWLWMSPNV